MWLGGDAFRADWHLEGRGRFLPLRSISEALLDGSKHLLGAQILYEYPPAVRVVQRPRQGGLWRGSGIESHREPAPQTPLRQLVIVHGVALADSDS